MPQREAEVASAAPSAPIAGAPRLPKMKIQLSAALTTLAPSITTMPALGRRMLSRKNEVAMPIIIPGMPQENIAITSPPPRASAGSWPVASRKRSPPRQKRPAIAPSTRAWIMARRQIAPQSWRAPAPSAWALSTAVPASRPMQTKNSTTWGARPMAR